MTQTAAASSREWVIERSIAPAFAAPSPDSRHSAGQPHVGLRPAGDLDVLPGERAGDAEAEAFPTASFPAKRAA